MKALGPGPAGVLVLWEEGPLGHTQARAALAALRAGPARATLCLRGEAGAHVPAGAGGAGRNVEDVQALVRAHACVLLPMLAPATLDAVAQAGFADPFAAAVLTALCDGARVFVLRAAVDPRRGRGGPAPLARILDGRLALLASLGIETVEGMKTVTDAGSGTPGGPENSAREPGHGGFVTERDLLGALASGGDLRLPPGGRLTPLARDLARLRGIPLE